MEPSSLQVPVDSPSDAAAIWLLDADQRARVRVCLGVMSALITASLVGVASWLWLVNHHPLVLIALSPVGRHLLLVAPTVNPYAFVAVVVARRMLFYLASFHLGRALGPAGFVWVEARAARFARFARWLERIFARSSHLIVFLFAGPTLSAIAGASRMRPRVFASLAATGLALRAVAVIAVAESLRGYIEIALAWIDDHWVPGTVLMVALVALYRWRRRTPTVLMED